MLDWWYQHGMFWGVEISNVMIKDIGDRDTDVEQMIKDVIKKKGKKGRNDRIWLMNDKRSWIDVMILCRKEISHHIKTKVVKGISYLNKSIVDVKTKYSKKTRL